MERVLGRTLRRARAVIQSATAEVGQVAKEVFRNRLRSARKAAREISQATRRRTKKPTEQYYRTYRKLVRVTQVTVAQAEEVVE